MRQVPIKYKGRPRWVNVNKIKCPHCGSVRLCRAGIVKKKQRYFCKNCGHTTIAPKGGKKK